MADRRCLSQALLDQCALCLRNYKTTCAISDEVALTNSLTALFHVTQTLDPIEFMHIQEQYSYLLLDLRKIRVAFVAYPIAVPTHFPRADSSVKLKKA